MAMDPDQDFEAFLQQWTTARIVPNEEGFRDTSWKSGRPAAACWCMQSFLYEKWISSDHVIQNAGSEKSTVQFIRACAIRNECQAPDRLVRCSPTREEPRPTLRVFQA
jgi:hypothetical protein